MNLRRIKAVAYYRRLFSMCILLSFLIGGILFTGGKSVAAEIRTNPPYEPGNPWPFEQAKNVFLKAKVVRSPDEKNRGAEYAVDGEYYDRYKHCGYKEHLTIDLEQPQEINTIRLWTYWRDDCFYQYYIEGSLNGETWTILVDRRANTRPALENGEVLRFPRQQVRYVRTTFTYSSYDNKSGGRIVEIQGFALDSEVLAELDLWEKVGTGLHGSFGSIDQRYDRDKLPCTKNSMTWSGTAWRGERVSAQIVLWTADGADQVRFTTTPLRSKDGREIPTSAVRPQFVRYVLGDANLIPDVLDTADQLDIPARSTRPIWLSIDIPCNAKAGLYHGNVNVTAQETAHRLHSGLM